MLWLIIAISAYFLFAVVNLADKYILGERIPDPGIYTFYMGALGILALAAAPFGFLSVPPIGILALAFLAGAFHLIGIYIYFSGLRIFEASRIIPVMGAFVAIFTLVLGIVFSKGGALGFYAILAFILLLLGSILITLEKGKKINFSTIKISVFAAIFFALYLISIKLVYDQHPLISGFVWTRVGAFLVALCFLFSKAVRNDIRKPRLMQGKTWLIFLLNETVSATSFIFQNWAVALAPVIYLGIISSLSGVQYSFVLIFGIILSLKFPQILKEDISRGVILQKIIAIILIGAGLVLLYL